MRDMFGEYSDGLSKVFDDFRKFMEYICVFCWGSECAIFGEYLNSLGMLNI